MKRLRIVSEDGRGHNVKVFDAEGRDLSGYFSGVVIRMDATNDCVTAELECPFVAFDVTARPRDAEDEAMLEYIEKRRVKASVDKE